MASKVNSYISIMISAPARVDLVKDDSNSISVDFTFSVPTVRMKDHTMLGVDDLEEGDEIACGIRDALIVDMLEKTLEAVKKHQTEAHQSTIIPLKTEYSS